MSIVGSLLQGLPNYVTEPPIEAVTFAFGVNEDFQLGLDVNGSILGPKVLEALLGTRLRGRSFARTPLLAGSRNSVAIAADGGVYSWGWNSRAMTGHGHRDLVCKPKKIAGLRGVEIVQVALGGWHCLYLDSQGEIYASGGDEYLQSNQGGKERDVLVPTKCLPGLRVCQVSAGGMHSLALTEDGQIWAWGEPWGSFSMTIDRNPRKVEVVDGNGNNVNFILIAAGAFHNLAVTDTGDVYSWGLGDYGQTGLGHTASTTAPQKIEDLPEPIADASAGGWHSALLTVSGKVLMFGRGEYGRLGLGDKSGSSKLRPTLIEVLEDIKIVQVSCGGSHTMAVTADGRCLAWGRGSFGRLGTGEEKDAISPVEVKLPGGPERWHVIACAAGGRHSMCLALPDNGDLDERQSSGWERRRSPMGLSPQSSGIHLSSVIQAAAGSSGPVVTAHRGRHSQETTAVVVQQQQPPLEVAVGGGGNENEENEIEADDELGDSEFEDESELSSLREAIDAAEELDKEEQALHGGDGTKPLPVGAPVESLITEAAAKLALQEKEKTPITTAGGGGSSPGSPQQAPYFSLSPLRKAQKPGTEKNISNNNGDDRNSGDDVGTDGEMDSDEEDGAPSKNVRRAASQAAATIHGLRDDLLGDRP